MPWRPARRRSKLSLLVASAALVVIFVVATRADAHALLISSDPMAGATLAQSPTEVVITFGEQPDPALSTIKVLDTSGQTRAGGRPQPVPGQPVVLRISVPKLPNGVYTVTWQTVSKVDGHLAGGAYAFGVGVSPAGAAVPKTSVRTPRPSGLAVGSRWIYLSGLIGLLGFAFTELVIRPGDPAWRRLGRGLAAAWLAAAVGAVAITQAQRTTAHVPLAQVLSSSLGHSLKVRGVPLLVCGVFVLVALLAGQRFRRVAVAVLGASALAAMLADVTTSHAAAAHGWEWFRVGSQWVHVGAVGIWIGGLAGLLVCLGAVSADQRSVIARRFSFVAGVAILVVLLTGTLRAVDEIATWHELFHTGFGQVVLIKVTLLGVLAVLGAVNRYRNVPAAKHNPRGLRRVGTVELAVVTVVLLATAVLQNLAPARSAAAPAAPTLRPIAIDAHDFATTIRLHLTVTPGTAGFDQFRLQVANYDTGQPVQAAQVKLTFHFPERTDVGDSTLALTRSPDGSYSGQGANLALQGRWQITVLVQGAQQSTEVPIDLVTQSPFLPTDVQHNAGLPTFYNIHLSGGRQLQVYLDPGHPGFNEFHATFLGADGNELAISTFNVTQALEPAGSETLLTNRKLDILGHYVADAPSQRGTYRFTVAAVTSDGSALGADVDVPVK
jgi:copper transport protein